MASAGSGSNNPSEKSSFDPYHELLGIPAVEQPPTYYRLLGLAAFESSSKVIERAADRQLQHLRTMQTGPYAAAIQKLLNEISKAQVVLLDPAAKAKYDTQLQAQVEARKRAAKVTALPQAKPLKQAAPILPTPIPMAPVNATHPVAAASPLVAEGNPGFAGLSGGSGTTAPRRSPSKPPIVAIAGLVGGALALLVLAIVVWQFSAGQTSQPIVVANNPASSPPNSSNTPPLPSDVPVTPAAPSEIDVPETSTPEPPPAELPTEPSADPVETTVPSTDPATTPTVEPSIQPLQNPVPLGEIANPDAPANQSAETLAELEEAKRSLRSYPTFEKYYSHLDANPEKLATNGPKLAQIIWEEVTTSKAIFDHKPSYLAAMDEVERLALAGRHFDLALSSIGKRLARRSKAYQPDDAFASKNRILTVACAPDIEASKSADERRAFRNMLLMNCEESIVAQQPNMVEMLLATAAKSIVTATERVEVAYLLLTLLEVAVAERNVEAALLSLATFDEVVSKLSGQGRKELGELRGQYAERFEGIETYHRLIQELRESPDDSVRNEKLGHFLLEQGLVEESLPYLAKGSTSELQQLAIETRNLAGDSSSLAALADRWNTLATDEKPAPKIVANKLLIRALEDPQLKGLPRAALETRRRRLEVEVEPLLTTGKSDALREFLVTTPTLKQPRVASTVAGRRWRELVLGKWVDVMPHIGLREEVLLGQWYLHDRVLTTSDAEVMRCEMPLKLANCDYDLEYDCIYSEGKQRSLVILPMGKSSTYFAIDDHVEGGVATYFYQGYRPIIGKPSKDFIPGALLKKGGKFHLTLMVRQEDDGTIASCKLNDQNLISTKLPLDASNNIGTNWPSPDPSRLVLGTHQTFVSFSQMRVRVVKGRGLVLSFDPEEEFWPADVKNSKPIPLGSLPYLEEKTKYDPLGISTDPRHPIVKGVAPPVINGVVCRDYMFAHTPSRVTYDIPPKVKYFTSYCVNARSATASFSVVIDGVELFRTEGKAISRCCVEIPPGSKTIELVCGDMGDDTYDHTIWAYPAFR